MEIQEIELETIKCPDIDGHKCRGTFIITKHILHNRFIRYSVCRDCSKCKFRFDSACLTTYHGWDEDIYDDDFFIECEEYQDLKLARSEAGLLIQDCHERIKKEGAEKILRRKPRHVYAFEMDNTSVKIGVSANIQTRKKSVSNQSGMAITRWHATEPLEQSLAFSLEAKLHAKFKDYRKQGEFFQIPFDDVVAAMTAMT